MDRYMMELQIHDNSPFTPLLTKVRSSLVLVSYNECRNFLASVIFFFVFYIVIMAVLFPTFFVLILLLWLFCFPPCIACRSVGYSKLSPLDIWIPDCFIIYYLLWFYLYYSIITLGLWSIDLSSLHI